MALIATNNIFLRFGRGGHPTDKSQQVTCSYRTPAAAAKRLADVKPGSLESDILGQNAGSRGRSVIGLPCGASHGVYVSTGVIKCIRATPHL